VSVIESGKAAILPVLPPTDLHRKSLNSPFNDLQDPRFSNLAVKAGIAYCFERIHPDLP
jgi:hypothetical protein